MHQLAAWLVGMLDPHRFVLLYIMHVKKSHDMECSDVCMNMYNAYLLAQQTTRIKMQQRLLAYGVVLQSEEDAIEKTVITPPQVVLRLLNRMED